MADVYRTGRKVGRTVYRAVGPELSDDDVLVGMLDTRELAAVAVEAMNAAAAGRLLPEGGDTRQEWSVWCQDLGGITVATPLDGDGEQTEEEWARWYAANPLPGITATEIRRRDIHVGPWQPVDAEGGQ